MAANEAVFKHGEYRAIDYVATEDIDGGEVVLIGNTAGLSIGIAHHPIANTKTGSLAAGGGVYEVVAAGNYANGAKVWWVFADKKVSTTSTNNAQFGYLVKAATTNNLTWALHIPHA